MSEWTWQGWFALVGGTLIFFAVLVPLLLVQLRRFGQMSTPRVFGAAAVSIYTVALVAYTLLPFPDTRQNCSAAGGSGHLELLPGHSIGDIARETAGLSLLGVLTSHAMLQVLMNVVLFVPFGIIVRRYWNQRLDVTIALGALVSLLIESTQLTGIWGIFECPYRVTDVDDLIANTVGAAIGGVLAPLLLAWMPSARALRATRHVPRPVTVWRRWFGMILDATVVSMSISLLSIPIQVLRLLTFGDAESTTNLVEVLAIGVGTVVLVIVLPSLTGSGASIGQRLVWLAPRWSDGRGSVTRRLFRASVVTVPYIVSASIAQLAVAPQEATQSVVGIVTICCSVVVIVGVVSAPFTKSHRGISFALASASVRDSREHGHGVGDDPGRENEW